MGLKCKDLLQTTVFVSSLISNSTSNVINQNQAGTNQINIVVWWTEAGLKYEDPHRHRFLLLILIHLSEFPSVPFPIRLFPPNTLDSFMLTWLRQLLSSSLRTKTKTKRSNNMSSIHQVALAGVRTLAIILLSSPLHSKILTPISHAGHWQPWPGHPQRTPRRWL